MLAAALLAWVSNVAAQSSRPTKLYSLSISRGSLASALDQFSKQTGLQVGAADLGSSEEENRQVGPLIGRVTADAALAELLDGSDLTFAWEDPYTIRIYNGIVKPRAEDNVQEVLVTGTRLHDGDGPAPVRVFSGNRIDRYGVSSLADLSRYFTQQPFSFGEGYQPSGAQHFQMRGLGADTTLVLINGRRAAPSANSISFNAFDLNTIPPTAVDRIEVMSDSASAIYGADAVGGVVNIILREEVEQPEVSLHYGSAAGGGEEQRVSAAIGSSSERLKSTLVFDYFERGELLGADRDLWRNQDFTRFGGTDYRLSTANPGNVYSVNGQPLPGLTSSFSAVPIGSSGVGLTPADFASTAGTRNLFSSYSVASIVPDSTRTTGYGAVEFELTSRLKLFGEVLVSQSRIEYQQRLPTISRELVPATNPFNPFGVPVTVDYAFVGVDPVSIDMDSELTRLVAGSRGQLRAWDWEIAAVHSAEETHRVTANNLDLSRIRAAIRSEDPASALNLFRDGPAGSDELLASLVADPLRHHFSFDSSQVSGFFRGPLFELPSGAAELVIGGEWRREGIKYFDTSRVVEERDVASTFAEMKVPLLDKLSLKVALRRDHYKEISDALNPQYGLVWKPSNEWLLRAAYGTSFRPPSLFELYLPRSESSFPVADARRGGAVTNLRFLVGGNPELDAVTARSFTTGFVFTPRDLPSVRLAASYWRVVMDNRVLAPSIDLLNREDEFPGRITRSAPTAEDTQAGQPGALVSLDLSRMNYGSLDTSGVDLEMSYLIERGLSCTLAATWVDEYVSRELFSTFPEERVGIAHILGTVPKWRVVGTLTWKSHDFGASTTVRFTPPYQDAELAVGWLDRGLPSRTVVDLQSWLELGSMVGEGSFFAGSMLTLGLMNATNEAPDFARIGGAAGYDVSQADLTQRFAYLRFSKRF